MPEGSGVVYNGCVEDLSKAGGLWVLTQLPREWSGDEMTETENFG